MEKEKEEYGVEMETVKEIIHKRNYFLTFKLKMKFNHYAKKKVR
jgi:hypothetical protein